MRIQLVPFLPAWLCRSSWSFNFSKRRQILRAVGGSFDFEGGIVGGPFLDGGDEVGALGVEEGVGGASAAGAKEAKVLLFRRR